MEKIYLDNAATTQLRDEVVDKIAAVMKESYGNPSSTHAYGRSAKSLVEKARKGVAKLLNVKAAEIIFTSGGTEADNLVLVSAVRDLGVKRMISSRIEHHAVLHTLEHVEKQFGTLIEYVNLDSRGQVDFKHLEELLSESEDKTLVSLMHVNNEVGNITDIKRVGNLCRSYGALFHSDTVQSVGHFEMDLQEIPVDFTAVSAHKFHGPKGVGFAYIRQNSGLRPLIFGGEQERGLRAGTEGVHNIVGLQEALEKAYQNLDEERKHIQGLKNHFIQELKANLPGVKFNGACEDFENSTYTLVNACLPFSAEKATLLLFQLDLHGIACSKGSACQSGSDRGSHVLNAFLNEEDLQKPSVRFSFSHYNTLEEIDHVVSVLKEYGKK